MIYALIARFRRKPLQNSLLLTILVFHLTFLFAMLFLSPDSFRKKERKHLIVRTVVEQPKPKTTAAQKAVAHVPAPAAPKKAPEVKKQIATPAPPPAPAKKPAAVKEPAIADKKIAPAKQAPPPKAAPTPPPRAKISDSLLKELEESIAKIENKSDKPAINKKASSATPIALQIDSMAEEGIESSYTDTLIGHLHASLSLPDYGEVKIQLSLRQDGTVVKVVVLKAKNEKNRQYLESNLPRLRFPRFDGAWANKKEHTFVLTFCNEQ